MKIRSVLLPVGLALFAQGTLPAQSILVDWGATWSYMHPTTGALPAGSGPTEPHPDGTTPWYAVQSEFAASYTGPSFTTAGAGFDAGAGAAPIGYGPTDYFGAPLPPPAEISALGTTLTTPADGSRRTGYFRTTFTVPNDGKTYSDPVIRYILDDGGYIYLDGVLVLRVNGADVPDAFLGLAAGTANTESHIRQAVLSLAAGSTTGGNDVVVPAIAGNATVVEQVSSLAPGVHTIAVSCHNAAVGSSDLLMALQLQAGTPVCTLSNTVSGVVRDPAGTPADGTDDTISFKMNVVPTGTVSASWKISGPAGSAAVNQGGAYNTDVPITGIPISEFGGTSRLFVAEDSVDPSCRTSASIAPPRLIGTFDLGGELLPISNDGIGPVTGWVFDDNLRTLRMNNGGGGTRKVVRSEVIDLSAIGEVGFTGTLMITDTSSGNEAGDSFVAYLVIDGDTANPVNLITPHDTLLVDGVLSDDELAPARGDFERSMSHIIPEVANSVQIVIEGTNDSGSETYLVKDLLMIAEAPSTQGLFFDVSQTGNNLVFTWSSASGLLYNLRSEVGLDTAPIDWPIVAGQGSLVATPPLNTLTIPRPADPKRFYAIESFSAPPSALLQDNFENGQGQWTLGSDGAAGTAWQLGTPTSGPGAANSPVNCFGTNLAGPYAPNANVWLRSPTLDLTSAGSATLRYFHYKDIDDGFHFGVVTVIDAATNAVLGTFPNTNSNLAWTEVVRAVPSAALGKLVKIEFRFTSDAFGTFPGWYIDDVRVTVP